MEENDSYLFSIVIYSLCKRIYFDLVERTDVSSDVQMSASDAIATSVSCGQQKIRYLNAIELD